MHLTPTSRARQSEIPQSELCEGRSEALDVGAVGTGRHNSFAIGVDRGCGPALALTTEHASIGRREQVAVDLPLKKALLTGITGQDGSYLAEFLLDQGYEVHGIKRRSSSFNTDRIDHIYQDPHLDHRRLILHYGDLTDTTNLIRIIQQVQPDEIYNLAAQSHVQVSFELPEYTGNADALGALRVLEALRILGLGKKTRFFQASTSELYGLVKETPQ